MADVAGWMRVAVKKRDAGACVACGSRQWLTMQHRARVGMGGSSLAVGFPDLVAACVTCNEHFEAGGQTAALVYGWKVRSWADPCDVPVFYRRFDVWALLDLRGGLHTIDRDHATGRMRDAYGEEWGGWVAQLRRREETRGVGA